MCSCCCLSKLLLVTCWVLPLVCLFVCFGGTGDAEGRGAHKDIPQRDCEQQTQVQGENCPGRWLWHWHSLHVCCPSRRQVRPRPRPRPLHLLWLVQPGDVRGSAHGFVTPLLCRHVYGIDCSSIIEQATEIVKINGFAVRVLCCGSVLQLQVSLMERTPQADSHGCVVYMSVCLCLCMRHVHRTRSR